MRAEFIIPGPAVPTARPRFVRGRAVTPARTVLYQAHVRGTAREILPASWDTAAWYAIDVLFIGPGRGDIDNLCKSILDGLTGPAWADDSQVIELHAEIWPGPKPQQRTEILITTRRR